MHKDDLAEIIQNGLVATGESIVNPRCDTCNTMLPTPLPHEIGMPRLCTICTMMGDRVMRAHRRELMSQERPRGRTIHAIRTIEPIRPVWGPPKVTPTS